MNKEKYKNLPFPKNTAKFLRNLDSLFLREFSEAFSSNNKIEVNATINRKNV